MNMKKIRTLLKTGFLLFMISVSLCACGSSSASKQDGNEKAESIQGKELDISYDWAQMKPVGEMDLVYADQFGVTYYEDGYDLITIGAADQYLVIPEGLPVPEHLDPAIVCIYEGCDNIYLAASSAMDFFRELDALDHIGMTSTKLSDWSIPEVTECLENGQIIYAGKYSAPDYEMLTASGATVAIESTMIYHSPQTSEKLALLGIPVMVERSSYESHPLGRMEWIRLYGVLLGEEEKSETFFKDQLAKLSELDDEKETDQKESGIKTAFFYISSSGMINVRKNRDYVPEMIRMAGGTYVPGSAGEDSDNALSTMNMQMEQFYAEVVDADILIYNSTIEGELKSIDELISKNAMFADFQAVKNGQVYCTGKNMFQQPTAMAEMMAEMHALIYGDEKKELTFIHKLN